MLTGSDYVGILTAKDGKDVRQCQLVLMGKGCCLMCTLWHNDFWGQLSHCLLKCFQSMSVRDCRLAIAAQCTYCNLGHQL